VGFVLVWVGWGDGVLGRRWEEREGGENPGIEIPGRWGLGFGLARRCMRFGLACVCVVCRVVRFGGRRW